MGLWKNLFEGMRIGAEELVEDAKQAQIARQRAYALHPELRMLGKDTKSRKRASVLAPQYLKITQDCAQLVNTTVKPKIFFERYDLMEDTLASLMLLEGLVSFSGEKPSKALRRIRAQRDSETIKFIDRAHDRALKDAAALKTEKGRASKMQKFFDNMDTYSIYMSPAALAHLNELQNE